MPVIDSDGIAEIEWAVARARSGEATLRVGRCNVHSTYRPRAEAERLADRARSEMRERGSDLLVLIGLGLGYLPEALLERWPGKAILWDPFPEMTAQLDPAGHAQPPTSRRVDGPESFEAALADLATERTRPHVVIHPGYEACCRFEARFAAWALRRRLLKNREREAEGLVPSARALASLERFPFLRSADQIAGCLEGQTVIFAAPGPSLLPLREQIARREAGVLVAPLQSLRTLSEVSARVDFASIVDPKDYSSYLDGLERPFEWLWADSSCHPRILDHCPERTILFHLRTPHAHQLAWQACGLPHLDEPFVTVSEASLVLAHRLGARRLILCGVDLSSRERDARYGTDFRVPDREGVAVWTNPSYFHASRYLGWLCSKLANEGVTIHRVGAGLPIRGATPLSAEGLTAELADAPTFRGLRPPPPDTTRRARVALRVLDQLAGPAADAAAPSHAPTEREDAEGSVLALDPREARARCAAARAVILDRVHLAETRPAHPATAGVGAAADG